MRHLPSGRPRRPKRHRARIEQDRRTQGGNRTRFSYSPGLKKLGDEGFTWTAENLDKWIADPKAMLPDSPMSQLVQGISDAQERANIIAYLQTQ
jgi:cytochrome c